MTMLPAHASHEAARLQALQSYGILDTLPEEAFDQLATLAARVCDCPMAVVNFVDSERQWFKAAARDRSFLDGPFFYCFAAIAARSVERFGLPIPCTGV